MMGASLKARVKLGFSTFAASRLKFKGLFLCSVHAVLICQVLSVSATPAAAVCVKYSSFWLVKQQKQRPAAFFMQMIVQGIIVSQTQLKALKLV